MGALGIEGEEQGSNQGIRRHGREFYDARDKKVSVSAAALDASGANLGLVSCTTRKKIKARGLHI